VYTQCFANVSLGFFRTPCDPVPYGVALKCDPCSLCLTDVFGPPKATISGANTIVCNSYGWGDPDVPLSPWAVCAGHGIWNTNQYACTCNPGWALNFLDGYAGYKGETPTVCNACAPFYGKSTYSTSSCGALITTDPVTGLLQECAGHGVFDQANQVCQCFTNSTAGYWMLGPVTNPFPVITASSPNIDRVFTETVQSVTVQSCVLCGPGATTTPKQGCF
jgi:hypothetical protein